MMNNLNNPYFSVIIPCFNCRKTIERLLESLVNQFFDDMEVIIQDDGSTDNFMELVEPFKEKLNIKYFRNKPREVHCPSNTRQDGLENATGKWVTFIDHDDMFESNVFMEVKRCIEFNKERYLLVSDFREFNPETYEVLHIFDEPCTFWMHGKFYNRQFLIDYDIEFKEDLVSHEDHYFNQLVFGYIAAIGVKYSILKQFTYRWMFYADSTGKKMCEANEYGFGFIDRYYEDYLNALLEPLFMLYDKYPRMKDLILFKMTYVMLYAYFYYQSLYYRRKFEHYLPNKIAFGNYLNRIKSTLGVTNYDIAMIIYSDSDSFNSMRGKVFGTCGDMIEHDSFYTFIESF